MSIAQRLATVVIQHPWRAIGIAALLTATAGVGLRNVEFSNNYRVFFGPANPDLLAFENFQKTHTQSVEAGH